jgi:hypothetical protein
VGLFVRHADEWDWLRSTLSIQKIKDLLQDEYKGGKIDRFEIPGLVSPFQFSIHDSNNANQMRHRMLFIFY